MKTPVITHNTNTIMTLPLPKGLYKISIINGLFKWLSHIFFYGMSIKKNIAIVISWDVCNLWISLAPLYVHNSYGVNSVNYKLICVEWIKHKFTFVKDYWWFEFPQIEILSSMDIPLMLWCNHQYFMLLVHNFI